MQTVTFSWPDSTASVYEVQYKKSSASVWSQPSGSPVTGTSISISDLEDETDYDFRVRALNDFKVSPWAYYRYKTSAEGCVAPSNVAVSGISQNAANVSWDSEGTAVNGYIVQWKKSTQLAWLSSGTLSSTSHTITGLSSGTKYDVKVLSVCADGGTSDSGGVHFTTSSTTTLCSALSTTALAVDDTGSTYTATWANTGGIPQTNRLEYSTNGTTWNIISTIVTQGSTSAVYTIPLLGAHPSTHTLKVTPQCADSSFGTSDTFDYEVPEEPTEYVTFANELSSGTITFINIDGSPNILTSSIAPGAEKNWNQTDLLGENHAAYGKVTGISIGTELTITHKRDGDIVSENTVLWNGNKFPISISSNFQDQDIFEIS